MTWRTGTKNPHALYYDMGGVSVPHGFIMHPDVARRIVDAMRVWLDEQRLVVPPKTALGRALGYLHPASALACPGLSDRSTTI